MTCARAITSESLAPIFLTSAVTGQGLDLLRLFINLTPQRQRWAERRAEPVEFIIDETFGVPGVGTVVAGTIKRGVLNLQVTFFHLLLRCSSQESARAVACTACVQVRGSDHRSVAYR